jgi:methyl-accepting chemotaxis protein
MSFFNQLRLSTRIYIQQAVLLVALIVIAAYSLMSVRFVNDEIHLIRDQQMPLSRVLSTASDALLEYEHHLERVMRHGPNINRDDEAISEFTDAAERVEQLYALSEQSFIEAETKIQDIIDTDIGAIHRDTYESVLEAMTPLRKQYRDYHATSLKIVAGFKERRDVSALTGQDLEQIEKDLAKTSETFIASVQDIIEEPLDASANSLSDLSSSLWVLSIGSSAIALVMAVLTGMILSSLRKSMGNIENSVQQVASASSQSSNAIGLVADGAKQQSQAIDQAVTAVNQSVSVLADVSNNAEKATGLSKQAAETVTDGQAQMQEMIAVVNRISENSEKINKITDMIDEIANQTNMLSLNAAIEAARAGEHGKGFAVVADQVRKLAENSRNSVKDIVELISIASGDADSAVTVAGRVNSEMEKIATSANDTERMMRSIATAMEEQVATTEELQHNMDTLKSIGENNANAAEEITQTIIELSRIADETNTEVSRFNI